MKCQKCDNSATIHLTEIVNGVDNSTQKIELHLCEECARDHELNLKDGISIADLVLDWSNSTSKQKETEGSVCSVCGWSMEKFRKQGKFGCSNDYSLFKDEIQAVLRKLHNDTVHCGKAPCGNLAKDLDESCVDKTVENLEGVLKIAIENEEYEEAARLRDEIKALREWNTKA